MNYSLKPIDAKKQDGDVLFLYGDESAERSLPLSRKEAEMLKKRRGEERDLLLVFDRLPHHLYVLSFNSEKPAPECQEKLRRRSKEVLAKLEADKVEALAVTGEP